MEASAHWDPGHQCRAYASVGEERLFLCLLLSSTGAGDEINRNKAHEFYMRLIFLNGMRPFTEKKVKTQRSGSTYIPF